MRFRLLGSLGLCALCALSGSAAGSTNDRLIGIDDQGFQLGRLVWNWSSHDRASTLTDFSRVFGQPTTCRLGKYRDDAHVVWKRRRIRGEFTTLGAFPRASDTACTARSSVHPDTVEVFDGAWRTSRGLGVGDTVQRLRTRYPHATRHGAVWWLVTRRNDHLFGTYGQLAAGIRSGRVSFLRLVLHEQGD